MIVGVDEAGKGSVLGPMVIAAVGCNEMDDLKSLGVADSKKLSKESRERLNGLIREKYNFSIVVRTALEIDTLRQTMTMNEIVARAHAEALDGLSCRLAYLDACDVNEKRYGETVKSFAKSECSIIARHKADALFPVVSAASIIAKVERDHLILDLAAEYGEIGSGYPSDPVTITFLENYIKTHDKPPQIARLSWETVKQMMDRRDQRSLLDF
ncbi:ribonuclease HII [Methanospirillum stamsii]|uniref:Ribonuclease HII n=1 Tax=Methanospirillum stamsii TaxID=1277351 RepID=A0A2V2N6J4_9EURY|nr:ribonuclease HII [Methanospirillum stamsii]PWR73346.1 ribonuclease HII [Methanospirillum stamsii]